VEWLTWAVWIVGLALIFVSSTYLWGRRFLVISGVALLVAAAWMLVVLMNGPSGGPM
jgi:hypothetical protein